MTIRDTLMAIRVKKQLMTIHLNGIFSIPLRVCGKVVILQRETQIGFCMDLLRFR